MSDIIDRLQHSADMQYRMSGSADEMLHDAISEIEKLRRHVGVLQEKLSAETSCACGYDSPDAVCLAHSPQLMSAKSENNRLREEVERLHKEHEVACRGGELLRAEVERMQAEMPVAKSLETAVTCLTIERDKARSVVAGLVRETADLRAEVERLRLSDNLTRTALGGWVFVPPDGGAEPTHDRVAAVVAEVDRLRAMLPPTAYSGVRNGPGEGSWSVFAEKVVEERDAAKAEVERITRQRDAWATEANRLREELRWYTDPRNSDSGTRARLALWGRP